MQNVKLALSQKTSVNFLYLNHHLEKLNAPSGVEILLSPLAYKKYKWVRKYFISPPKEGYFIWVKNQPSHPLSTCVGITQRKVRQGLNNLLVVESGIKAESQVACSAFLRNLYSEHRAEGKIILKENSSLSYKHLHSWAEGDFVEPNYEFILEKGAQLDYQYQLLNPPQNLTFKTKYILNDNAKARAKIVILSKKSIININEEMILSGKNTSGSVFLRLVGDKNSQIHSISRLVAKGESRGHLDCQGLILDNTSQIRLVPELINENKKALLTHEASIGRINEEELNYLRARGLTLKEATELIVNGFLQLENQ